MIIPIFRPAIIPPYFESPFQTIKYCPWWLDNCFRSIEEVSAWLSRLTLWYNQEQKCKGINDEHAAVLYSLIGTCRLNNVEPEKWLRYVIEHIQDWPANRVRDLLP
ncbi:hypothetical protein BBJ25_00980 [Escherichia coli]|nr:hypothetical protein A9815_07725 [Escherichia coli]PBU07268.1 hypothetical protein BBJ23_24655 [Escherichia coli]PBU21307.1 hypothetical protein BBJ25_00980 [Escherichia coli]